LSDSFLSQALAAGLSAVLATTAVVVSRTMPSTPAPQEESAQRLVFGRDVSWPNCPRGMGISSRRSQGKPMPPPSAGFVIIGLTNGPAFHPNPCLAAQVDYAKAHHLRTAAYAVVTYPTRRQLRRHGEAGPHTHARLAGRLWNTGWTQARRNIAVMRAAGLDSPIIWVDVEPVSPPATWSTRRPANRAVLDGAVASYRDAGYRVGFYSTANMWRDIVGAVRYGFPEWRTAGLSTRRAALSMCRRNPIQGGEAVIAQWYSTREDFDLLCPGKPAETVLREYFTPY
jgi:hypothetical protein